eukprot:TRINITY_DN929_c0_g2_i1.p1 TRINITY_DN929_c0_g2~~TRINITY_DN929_c0_g2_i1.p1  ORF type:complete len:283 (-),score=64.96 TRINITY_DN929_c0_g2_i1:5-853(-)
MDEMEMDYRSFLELYWQRIIDNPTINPDELWSSDFFVFLLETFGFCNENDGSAIGTIALHHIPFRTFRKNMVEELKDEIEGGASVHNWTNEDRDKRNVFENMADTNFDNRMLLVALANQAKSPKRIEMTIEEYEEEQKLMKEEEKEEKKREKNEEKIKNKNTRKRLREENPDDVCEHELFTESKAERKKRMKIYNQKVEAARDKRFNEMCDESCANYFMGLEDVRIESETKEECEPNYMLQYVSNLLRGVANEDEDDLINKAAICLIQRGAALNRSQLRNHL